MEKSRLVCIAPVLGSQHGLSALRKAQDTIYRSRAGESIGPDPNHEQARRLRWARKPWRYETNQTIADFMYRTEEFEDVKFLVSEQSRLLTVVRMGVQRLARLRFDGSCGRRHKNDEVGEDEHTRSLPSNVCNCSS